MLKMAGASRDMNMNGVQTEICRAVFPEPFASGLEYNAPARGPWNIVHTGMLIPQSHQIFVCAQGCLRGVILTAAEMNAQNRMSWVSVCENDMFDGTMESDIIDGTADILKRMDTRPRAVLLFLSCIHFFAGCDFGVIIGELSARFPDISFIDCYMNPTMRKSGLTPDQLMRKQLYGGLSPTDKKDGAVNIIGCDRATDSSSELIGLISKSGRALRDITLCKSYGEYLDMAKSSLNITYIPAARAAADELEIRLGQKQLYLPLCYGFDEIRRNYDALASALGLEKQDFSAEIGAAEAALDKAAAVVGNAELAVDYTATPRPLGLARLLCEHGFNVRYIYADAFSGEEREDFEWLQSNRPDILIRPTVNVKMRFVHSAQGGRLVAVGQKAAYFCGTDNFVNIVAGGGMYGFDGIKRLAGLIEDAFLHEKDRRTVIQKKGLGCESCL